MGSTFSGFSTLLRDEGFRFIRVEQKSPLYGLVDPFFDFLVTINADDKFEIAELLEDHPLREGAVNSFIPPTHQTTKYNGIPLDKILLQEAGRSVQLRIVSTKYRNIKRIRTTVPFNGLQGLSCQLRTENYNVCFSNYCPINNVLNNSPALRAGILKGSYLLGCLNFPYQSITELSANLSELYYNPNELNKDEISIKSVELCKGWGGKGLLGAQILEGQIYKWTGNVDEARDQLIRSIRDNSDCEEVQKKGELWENKQHHNQQKQAIGISEQAQTVSVSSIINAKSALTDQTKLKIVNLIDSYQQEISKLSVINHKPLNNRINIFKQRIDQLENVFIKIEQFTQEGRKTEARRTEATVVEENLEAIRNAS